MLPASLFVLKGHTSNAMVEQTNKSFGGCSAESGGERELVCAGVSSHGQSKLVEEERVDDEGKCCPWTGNGSGVEEGYQDEAEQ